MSKLWILAFSATAILGIIIGVVATKHGLDFLVSATDNAHLRNQGACAWDDERGPRRFTRLLVARADGGPVSADLKPTSRRAEWSADHVARLAPSVSEPGRCMVAAGAGNIAGSSVGTPAMSPDGRFVHFFAELNAGDTIRPGDSDPPLRWIEPETTASNFLITLGIIFTLSIPYGTFASVVYFGKSIVGNMIKSTTINYNKWVEVISTLMIIVAIVIADLLTGYLSIYPEVTRSERFAAFDQDGVRQTMDFMAHFWLILAVSGVINIVSTLRR